MKHLLLIILSYSAFIQLFGQVIKTYNGKYNSGKAVYQYYETENYERVFHGTFKYDEHNMSVKGMFNHNKRNGKWVVKQTSMNTYYEKKLIKVNYINGKLDGDVIYESRKKNTNELYAYSKATFKDNILINNFYYKCYGKYHGFEINIPLDSNGLINGKVYIKYNFYGDYEIIGKYKHGKQYFFIKKDIQTGEVLTLIDETPPDDMQIVLDSTKTIATKIELSSINSMPEIKMSKGNNYDIKPKLSNNKKYIIENVPLIIKYNYFYIDVESFWAFYDAMNFWTTYNSKQESKNRTNPLFSIDKGYDDVDFKPLADIFIDGDKYIKINKEKIELEKLKEEISQLISDANEAVNLGYYSIANKFLQDASEKSKSDSVNIILKSFHQNAYKHYNKTIDSLSSKLLFQKALSEINIINEFKIKDKEIVSLLSNKKELIEKYLDLKKTIINKDSEIIKSGQENTREITILNRYKDLFNKYNNEITYENFYEKSILFKETQILFLKYINLENEVYFNNKTIINDEYLKDKKNKLFEAYNELFLEYERVFNYNTFYDNATMIKKIQEKIKNNLYNVNTKKLEKALKKSVSLKDKEQLILQFESL